MNPSEVIEQMENRGISIGHFEGNLKVTSRHGKISDDHKALIRDHKEALLLFLSQVSPENQSKDEASKSYELPTGEIIQLTLEEFQDVVGAFRMLLRQDQRNRETRKAA